MSTLALPLDQQIAHAKQIILLGSRPPDSVEVVDAELATTWNVTQAEVHRVFVEAWRQLLVHKSEYRAVIMAQLDEIMRWEGSAKHRVAAAVAALRALEGQPSDPGPLRHHERVESFRRALQDPDAALREAMELEGLAPRQIVG